MDDLMRLRYAIQGTITTGRALGMLSDQEIEGLSNTTVEAMSDEALLLLSDVGHQIQAILFREGTRRKMVVHAQKS
jgi:hypothetical protein